MRRKVTAGFGTLASRQAFMSISGLFNLYFSVYFFFSRRIDHFLEWEVV